MERKPITKQTGFGVAAWGVMLVLIAAGTAHAQCPCGNKTAQEYGDAVYRYLKGVTWANLDYNHTGIFSGMSQVDSKPRVLHAHGVNDCIVDAGLQEAFTYDPPLYYGAYTLVARNLSFSERRAIVELAQSFVGSGIDYTFWDALQYWGTSFDGAVSDIAAIRCDGLTEYCYERLGFRVWYNPSVPAQWDISQFPDIHNDAPTPPSNPYVELSPWAQRGAPTYYSGSQLTTNTDMLQPAIISLPSYEVTCVPGIGYADVTVRASDESGIHRIAVLLPGASEWTLSNRQPQHPTSDSYSYTVRVATEGTFAYVAMDNGGNISANAQTVNVTFTGAVSIALEPSAVVSAGAQWRIDGGAWRNSGAVVSGLNIGPHLVEFTPIPGWQTPPIQTVEVVAGQTTTHNVSYIHDPSSAPQAEFVASPISGQIPLQVQFLDESLPGLMPITSWAWDFGDGTGSVQQHPVHVYAVPGVYTVSLTITTGIASDVCVKPHYLVVKAPPIVDFQASPVTGRAPLTVHFTNATQPGSEPVSLWAWDFGDGGSSADPSPTHIYTEAGVYTVSLTAGTPGNTANATKPSLVVVDPPDTTVPVITLLGSSSVTLQGGGTYVDAGATAWDNVDGDITSRIVTVNPVNPWVLGTYSVTYDVSDAAGNAALQKKRTVKVVDTTKPVITLTGSSTITVNVFDGFVDPGATAWDNLDGDITSRVTATGSVNPNVVGTYLLYYNVTDATGNAATQKVRTVKVVDKVKPVVTLLGSTPVTLSRGSSYVDAGATAQDNYDGDVTSRIVTTSTVNTSAAGTYYVTYTVTDASNNVGTAKRTVKVTADTTKPVITLIGSGTVTVNVFDGYADAGATAQDNVDGDITFRIVTVNPVNPSVVGTCLVTYDVQDASGNAALQKVRTVKVVDKVKPVVTLLGTNPTTVNVFSPYEEPGATAQDNYDGDITSRIVTTGSVATSVLGTYYVTYTATDTSNNVTIVKRTVKVVDKEKPVITLLGSTPVTVTLGSAYADAGATAQDNYDGDITSRIVTTSTVNTSAVGSYTVKYAVKDASNNAATTVTRVVKVVSAP